MIDLIQKISGLDKLEKIYQLDKPKGVRGRSSNNELAKKILNWSYQVTLREGLEKTYNWATYGSTNPC